MLARVTQERVQDDKVKRSLENLGVKLIKWLMYI
jgi:hypothetical protein